MNHLLQAWELYEHNELVGLVDTELDGNFDAEEACRILKIGLLCTQDAPKLRPSMSTAVKMLTGKIEIKDKNITKPGLISDFMDLKVRGAQKNNAASNNNSTYNTSSSNNYVNNSTFSATSTTATTTFDTTFLPGSSTGTSMTFTTSI